MSKFFDALNKGKGEMVEAILPLMEGQAEAPQRSEDEGPDRPDAPAAVAAETSGVAPSEIREATSGAIRMLPLRVAAPSPLLPFEDGQWRASEQYRILRTKISQHPRQPRLVVISSPASGDGKSVTAVNVAAALSLKSEAKVLLVDADFRKSTISAQLGLPPAPGLAEVLKESHSLEQALVNTQEFPNLYVLVAGTPPDNPVELLDSPQWIALCERLRSLFRLVVIDSPPMAAVADYDLIQAACDGVILVVRPDVTNRQLCRKALDTVAKAKFLGVLMNCVPDWSLASHGSHDHYYYYGKNSPQGRES